MKMIVTILLTVEILVCLVYDFKKDDWSYTHTQTLFERIITGINVIFKICIVPTIILVML